MASASRTATDVCVSAAALIILSYLFDEHIIDEFAIIHGLEADLARQEFLKRIFKSATFIVAITVAGC